MEKTISEQFLEKYKKESKYIKFEPNKPVEVKWWGVERWSQVPDRKTGEMKEVVQYFVKIPTGEYKIITTASFSLISRFAEIYHEKQLNEDRAVRLKITQVKKKIGENMVRTSYTVDVLGEPPLYPEDRRATKEFLELTEEIKEENYE
jgi:hypothetical protein